MRILTYAVAIIMMVVFVIGMNACSPYLEGDSNTEVITSDSDTNAPSPSAEVTTSESDTGTPPPPPISQALAYKVNTDGETCKIVGMGTYTDTDINIPSTIDGYRVTAIGNSAFYYCDNLTSITIPDSVTTIGDEAFHDCSSLKSITIPKSVAYIGDEAFFSCGSLESVTVQEGNPIYHSAGNCLIETESKTLILGCNNSVIPDDKSVTSIGDWAFNQCKGLRLIAIPDSVTSIGDGAFYECINLMPKYALIPQSVTVIGEYAFYACESLASVEVPDNVTTVGKYAFSNCNNLMSVTLGNKVQSINEYTFAGCINLVSLKIGYAVKNIGEYAFKGCVKLETISYPRGTGPEWRLIKKASTWALDVPATKVICYDGTTSLNR